MVTIKLKDESGKEYEVDVSKLRPMAEDPKVWRVYGAGEEGTWEVQVAQYGETDLYAIGVMGMCDHEEELGPVEGDQRTAIYIGEDEVVELRDLFTKICADKGWG